MQEGLSRDFSQMRWPSRMVLRLLSFLYLVIVQLRNFLYDRNILTARFLPGKTISVGNIVAGGTGKSPFVIAVARYLMAKGYRPAIVTRGYRSGLRRDESMVLLDGQRLYVSEDSKATKADEAMMQSHELPGIPVIVGQKRFAAVQKFISQNPKLSSTITHWILDDGFQHRAIARDINIILMDSQDPFGNGFLLPCGTLREPLINLKRGSLVVFTRSSSVSPSAEVQEKIQRYGVKEFFLAPMKVDDPLLVRGIARKPLHDPSLRIAVLSAIASPQGFLSSLQDKGIVIGETYILNDHCAFEASQVEKLARNHDALVTTAKDFWRDPQVFDGLKIPVYILPIRFEMSAETLDAILVLPENSFSSR